VPFGTVVLKSSSRSLSVMVIFHCLEGSLASLEGLLMMVASVADKDLVIKIALATTRSGGKGISATQGLRLSRGRGLYGELPVQGDRRRLCGNGHEKGREKDRFGLPFRRTHRKTTQICFNNFFAKSSVRTKINQYIRSDAINFPSWHRPCPIEGQTVSRRRAPCFNKQRELLIAE
jgi:hypothetical protein